MKYIIIKLINIYQMMPFRMRGMCRFQPTCSNYMIDAINEYGAVKGVFLGIKRICRCHPWGGSGYDPVKRKEENI